MRMGEDHRLLTYGLDTMIIMTELVACHDALYKKNSADAEIAWCKVEEAAERLDSYFIPIGYEFPRGWNNQQRRTYKISR